MKQSELSRDQMERALQQVAHLREWVISRQQFRGFSGIGRMVAAFFPVIGAVVMTSPLFPRLHMAHLVGWLVIAACGFLLNLIGLVAWYWRLEECDRHPHILRPFYETFPPLFIAAAATTALARGGVFDPLFGVWMMLYGQIHLATRHSLPPEIGMVGLYYILCGAVALFLPQVVFLNPWPMAIVFFIGEMIGGGIFHAYKSPK